MADPEVYFPGNVPNEPKNMPRYIDEELHRIATAIPVPFANYTILRNLVLAVQLETSPTFGILFQAPPLIDQEIDVPDTQFAQLTGVWTCQADGIYDISCMVTGTAPGIGNQQWTLNLQTNIAGATKTTTATGQDDFPKTVTFMAKTQLVIGDEVYWEASAVAGTVIGATTDIDAYAQIWRLK